MDTQDQPVTDWSGSFGDNELRQSRPTGTYEHEGIHSSFPPMGTAQPAHMGSQSSVPMPRADPRGYDSTSSQRDFGKYPASMGEMTKALMGSLKQIWGGVLSPGKKGLD